MFARQGPELRVLVPRAPSLLTFERRSIPLGGVARRSNMAAILSRRASPSGRLGALGVTANSPHGTRGTRRSRCGAQRMTPVDDERRGGRAVTPCCPSGCCGVEESPALSLLDDARGIACVAASGVSPHGAGHEEVSTSTTGCSAVEAAAAVGYAPRANGRGRGVEGAR